MDTYRVYILLCIVQRVSVNGQKLVSHNDDVIVTSSSQIDGDSRWDTEHAVDGNADTDASTCNCCAATNVQNNPWYKVDLIQEYNIQRIHVLGRTDFPHTLYKLEIELGTTESEGAILQGVDTSDTSLRELDLTLTSPQPARYITLTLRDRADYFIICELYVYAACSGGLYGPECVHKCGQCQNNESCDGVTGECSICTTVYQSPLCKDCIAGYYGSTCELCGQCTNNDVCDKSNGNCPNGCSAGYQGTTCKQVCIDGRYGTSCNKICGQCNGINTVCDKSDGSCQSGCLAGYKGTTCKEVCDSGTYGIGCGDTCGKCENNATCNNVDGQCTACETGYLSPSCKVCIDGRYGTTCNKECGYCYNNDVCDKDDGSCPRGCSAGYQGNTCKEVCNPGTYGTDCAKTCGRCDNNAACNNVDGECTACSTGYRSPMCKDCVDGRYGAACTETCGKCYNSDPCDNTNASCPNGCSAGFIGDMCKDECEDGTFGLNCEKQCGNCFNCGPCNNIDGDCASCAAGYKGNTCVEECQAGTYGFNCKQRCGMCQAGDVCDKHTGECPNGCTVGYTGSQCSQEINKDTSSSSGTSFGLPVFIGSLIAVAVVIVTIVLGLGWLCFRKRLNQKTHKAANTEDTSIPLPNTPSNYDTLRFENLDGESTYTELNRRS